VATQIAARGRLCADGLGGQIRGLWRAGLFQMMDAASLRELVDDIRANGLREPITLLDGKVLDGRNRHEAKDIRRLVSGFRKAADSATDEVIRHKDKTAADLTGSGRHGERHRELTSTASSPRPLIRPYRHPLRRRRWRLIAPRR
jgi:plasmid replication initiation protein